MAAVSDLIAELRGMLRDAGFDLYSDTAISNALYDAELVTVAYKPEATAKDVEIATADGARQEVPSEYLRVMDIKYNGSLAAPGRGISMVAREHLDLISPSWRSANLVEEARQYAYDERNPRVFELFPPVVAGSIVATLVLRPLKYGDLTSATTTVGDEYRPALIEYALYRLFSEDTEGTPNESRSRKHYTNFFNFLGIKVQNEARVSPRQPEHKT
ncbi:DUF6682 family protein [Microbulbifer sp. GL-2]|uniref:phage adaptor protein n=1 Tax=Microbulbifer sp. GL-2 TaxID=2591606 RepID=UPI0011630F13|nr:DUF6682 family protein [Microbulbifer sp. GL-2]BBM03776.1 hypothetical protein GL2_38500 [Microbulbifer sp. GL-2]